MDALVGTKTGAGEPDNAVALATVDASGLPNVRMVLLKEIAEDGFIFYTNYGSAKARDANTVDVETKTKA